MNKSHKPVIATKTLSITPVIQNEKKSTSLISKLSLRKSKSKESPKSEINKISTPSKLIPRPPAETIIKPAVSPRKSRLSFTSKKSIISTQSGNSSISNNSKNLKNSSESLDEAQITNTNQSNSKTRKSIPDFSERKNSTSSFEQQKFEPRKSLSGSISRSLSNKTNSNQSLSSIRKSDSKNSLKLKIDPELSINASKQKLNQDETNTSPLSPLEQLVAAKRRRRITIKHHLEKSIPPKHLTGFSNLGNTCFMNASLQCLLAAEPLVCFFLSLQYKSDIHPSSPTNGHLAMEFGNLVKEIWGQSQKVIRPIGFKQQFDRYAPDHLIGYDQQDAQEFLRFLLDGLHEDLNRVRTRPQILFDEKYEDKLSDQEKANLSWNRYHSINDSFIFDLFGGQLQSSIQCLSCEFRSNTFEAFWDLSLPIPKEFHSKEKRFFMRSLSRRSSLKECTLLDCIKFFAEEEILDGKEKYDCPRCKSPQKATKSLRIYKFPEILMLHIKRFMQTPSGREKLTTRVRYDEHLKMTNVLSSKLEGHDEVLNGYELIGIVSHSGNLSSGHYVSHCKSIEDQQWYQFNDSQVSPSQSDGHESSAYILFYKKL